MEALIKNLNQLSLMLHGLQNYADSVFVIDTDIDKETVKYFCEFAFEKIERIYHYARAYEVKLESYDALAPLLEKHKNTLNEEIKNTFLKVETEIKEEEIFREKLVQEQQKIEPIKAG